jgi:molybdopterin-binding protein
MNRRAKTDAMRLSARNQLPGTILSIDAGAVTSTVKVRLEGGATMTSSITKESADELGLEPGKGVTVVVKASDVMIAVE